MADNTSLLVQIVLNFWKAKNQRASQYVRELTDKQLEAEIASGKNRGLFILGHLIAANDQLFPELGLGERLFPSYKTFFLQHPDRSIKDLPSLDELRQNWFVVLEQLTHHFDQMTDGDWLQPHTLVSEADFEKAPHRNKLNLLLNRTSHLDYHLGQLVLL